MKVFKILLVCISIFLVAGTVTAQVNKEALDPKETWKEFLDTKPTQYDLLMLFTDNPNASIEPYRTWALHEILSRDISDHLINDVFSSSALRGETIELAWKIAKAKNDKNIFMYVFAHGPHELRDRAFQELSKYDLNSSDLAILLGPPNLKSKIEDKYMNFFWSKFYSSMTGKVDLLILLRGSYAATVVEKAAQELLAYELTNEELSSIACNILVDGPERESATSRLFANNPSSENLKYFIHCVEGGSLELYREIATSIISTMEEEERMQKKEKLMKIMRIK